MPAIGVAPPRVSRPPVERPLLVFDGNCTFCRMWVDRWRAACADRLDIAPSQEAGSSFPEIPNADFDRAVQLIDTDGAVYSAAHAVLRGRALAVRRSWLLNAYQQLPVFAGLAETLYRLVANHRPLLSRLTRLAWGADLRRSAFGAGTWIFLRLLGVIHLIAFVSFWVQLDGLVGPNGILPAQPYLDYWRAHLGAVRFWYLPTACWLFGGGWFLHLLCGAGVSLSLALIAGVMPAVCLALLWIAYLSLCVAGQVFMNYQWDALLLETTLLAIFIAPWSRWTLRWWADPPRLARWLGWWLLIRLMLLSGAVKLLSGDPTWSNLTALRYHFATQPLPTWIGWYAHQLPDRALQAMCAIMFAIELGCPILLLLPRRIRHLGAALEITFQVLIALTGNYTFFNLLTVALCLLFFDDLFWRNTFSHLFRWRRQSPAAPPAVGMRWCPRSVLIPVSLALFSLTGIVTLATVLPGTRVFQDLEAIPDMLLPLRSINRYGLFAVMTRERPEIIIEGSDDGRTWLPYEFKAKPGDLRRRPGFVAPHQPRLDWQLWFAALESPGENRWVANLCVRLLEGSPEVLGLFASNPFPDRPPRQIRAVLYEYRFTDPAIRAATGRWWDRTPVDFYLPAFGLRQAG